MKSRIHVFTLLLCLVALAASGCRRNIAVRAIPPSVASPPPSEPASQSAATLPPAETKPETPLPSTPDAADSASIALTPAVKPAPTRPRPAPVEAEPPKPATEPEPQPPQISPELTPAQLADAQRRTSDDLRAAEGIVQLASAKQLNASQNDLYEKIKGFDNDAHAAITANDWVRAGNLAQKARVLSDELKKSL